MTTILRLPAYRFLCLAVALWIHTLSTSAQHDTLSFWPSEPAWAMEFGVGQNLTLHSFLGGTISVARYDGEGGKLRCGLSLYFYDSDADSDFQEFQSDTVFAANEGSFKRRATSIQMLAHVIWYGRLIQQTTMYAGVGPLITRSTEKRTEDISVLRSDGYEYSTRREISSSSWGVGVSAVCGIEWAFAQRMALHAEYEVQVVRSSSTNSSRITDSSLNTNSLIERFGSGKSSEWKIGSGNVRFGLTVLY